MNKLRIILIVIIVLLIGVLVLQKIPERKPVTLPKKTEPVYSDDPKTWVEERGAIREISVDKVTKGAGFEGNFGQQYDNGEIKAVFDYIGYYKGKYFRREYADVNETLLMRISKDMSPSNGIIEGFIIENIENGIPIAYIFLDEDWKSAMPMTNIFWGKTFQNEKEFVFAEVSDGIYMDKIEDDRDRFSESYFEHSGGIVVGDITRKNIESKDITGKTLIKSY